MSMDGAAAQVWLVADDYGLSPGVSRGIRELIAAGRLSGTGCMTLFPEWSAAAAELKTCAGIEKAAIGLHLTLTDFAPFSGKSALAPEGRLPPLSSLIGRSWTKRDLEPAVHAELDQQLDAFVSAMGHMPHYLDGHQHVHFLPPVRSWLRARHATLTGNVDLLWLRGAPSVRLADGLAMKAKISVVAGLAAQFDGQMRKAGYTVAGPLAGFYNWSRPEAFIPAMQALQSSPRSGSVVMCHPGYVDDMLRARDGLIEARETELRALMAQSFFPLKRRDGGLHNHAD